jgi:hypothetical protein
VPETPDDDGVASERLELALKTLEWKMKPKPIPNRPLLHRSLMVLAVLVLCFQLPGRLHAQALKPPLGEPTTPAGRRFSDSRYRVAFDIPAAWNLSRRDGEVSTFHLDARSAPATAQLRGVASISFNPYPQSTFSGALVYFSISPRTSDADCAQQAFLPLHRPATTTGINGISFSHGYDEHGGICTESRDDVYTAYHGKDCYRFDLVVNTFCGGEVSGVRDMNHAEMEDIRARERKILNSIEFQP